MPGYYPVAEIIPLPTVVKTQDFMICSFSMRKIGIYVHIPFCLRRCAYCDFVTYAGCSELIPEYIKCVGDEIESYAGNAANFTIRSIYFGGGTPSLLSSGQVRQIMQKIQEVFPLNDRIEVTLEANPGTEIGRNIRGYLDAGINRISLGAQSTSNAELRVLGRIHTHEETCRTVQQLRDAGCWNINLDLIYGVPGQTVRSWSRGLQSMHELTPEHFSLYCLTLEPAVWLGRQVKAGRISLPTDEETAEMYALAMKYLGRQGYEQYEISNWAKRNADIDFRSTHNLQYWRAGEYIGIGAGAHGYHDGYRYENVRRIQTYIERLRDRKRSNQPARLSRTIISIWEAMQEYMMLGLRLTGEGVNQADFKERFGIDMFDSFSRQIQKLTRMGIVEISSNGDRVRLTKAGRQIGNVAFREFVGISEKHRTDLNK